MKISVRVRPNSKKEEISREGDGFIVRVKEPPQEGRANQAVIKLLAGYFGVPTSRVSIVTGLSSKDKVIGITDE